MMRPRIAIVAIVCALVLASVVGCDVVNNSSRDVSVRIWNGQFELAVCKSITAVKVSLYTTDGDEVSEYWWNATGRVEIGTGETLTTDVVGREFSVVHAADEPDVTRGESLTVSIVGSVRVETMVATFPLDRELPTQGEWMRFDGSLQPGPCDYSSS